jgi:hypothetical protein
MDLLLIMSHMTYHYYFPNPVHPIKITFTIFVIFKVDLFTS